MTMEEFRESAFEIALRLGCSAAETYAVEGEEFSVNVLDGEVENYESSRVFGLGLRVQKDGKNGYAYTEVTDDPETLVRRAMDNAAVIETPDEHPMQTAQTYVKVTPPYDPVSALSERERIELALQMERAAKARDPRVVRMEYNTVCTSSITVRIHNTLGLAAEQEERSSYSYLSPLLQEGEEIRDGAAVRVGEKILDVEGIAREAVDEAARTFGARPVPPREYAVVLREDAASEFLSAFTPTFSASAAQKGLSLLAGKEGEKIAASCIDIIDDPLDAHAPRVFDDEGTPSVKKTVVEHGVLKTLLHNLKTAKKAGVESTSNAGRSASSPVGVTPTNFYIPAGERSYEELVAAMGDGLVITDLSGLHAGVNSVSGDFSLSANGLLIEGGKPVRAVEQITVAGNFISLLCDVQEVGSDLKMDGGGVASPSLRIRKIQVAGQ